MISGNNVTLKPELWEALPFTPRADMHAKTLSDAIGLMSGTKLVQRGIYSEADGNVGQLLPGGQGSTANIPDSGVCCAMASVTLPGAGVALTKGSQYWLVASPDNINAADFQGIWQDSSIALNAYQEPELGINWTPFSGDWRAAEILGTRP